MVSILRPCKLQRKSCWAGKRFCGFKSRCEYCTFIKKKFGRNGKTVYLCTRSPNAEIAQLVEHNLAKVRVASSSLVFRSFFERMLEWWNGRHEGLKILWPLRLCGFKSRFEYSIKLCESLICRAFSLSVYH